MSLGRGLCVLLAAAGLACGKQGAPAIASFSVDKPLVLTGDVVTFNWQVSGAKTLAIEPLVGPVTGNTAQVAVPSATTFVLTATNDAGQTTRAVVVTVQARPPSPSVDSFSATPAQAPAGAEVKLRWSVSGATAVTIDQGLGPQPASGGAIVHPAVNTLYTLTAAGPPGALAAAPVQAMFRVSQAPVISSFAADPAGVTQGQSVTLSWRGTATRWSVTDGTTTWSLGPLTSLVVTPAPPATTYTLMASSATGTATQPLTVPVAAASATALTFTAGIPAAADAVALRLNAASTTSLVVLELVAAQALTARALALNLPLDAHKVTLDPASLSVNAAAIDPGSPMAARLALGTGRLANTLVLGIAARASGGVPAPDVTIAAGTVIARFSLGVAAAGGPGVVWDGTRPAQATLRNAASRGVPISVAAGMLTAH
jgi:hypothetical protein